LEDQISIGAGRTIHEKLRRDRRRLPKKPDSRRTRRL